MYSQINLSTFFTGDDKALFHLFGEKNIFANPDFSGVEFFTDFRTVKIFVLRRREDRPKPAEIGRHSKNRFLTPESKSSPHFTMGKQFLQF